MTKYYRKKQIEATMHKRIAEILQFQIADPRLKNLSVTTVTLSKKLDYADIKVIQQQPDIEKKEILANLKHASSKIRSLLATQYTRSRTVPKIRFYYDDAFLKSIALSKIIERFDKNMAM